MFSILLTKCFQPYQVTVLILLWTYHFRVFQRVDAEISGLRAPSPNAPIFNRAPPQGHLVPSDPSLPPLDRLLTPPLSRYRPLPGCESCIYGGHNATCVRVSGLFTRPTLPVGYNVITKIPQGACAIDVFEMRVSKNYLALRDEKGNYVVNGRWNIDRSGHYRAAGTLFSYRRHDPRRNRGESLSAQGPLTEPILLLLIYQQPNPGISYEYSIPLQNATFRHPPMGVLPASPMEHLAPEPTNPQPPDSRRHHRRHRPHGHRTTRLEPPSNEALFNEDLTPALSFPSGIDAPKRLLPATGQGPAKKPGRGKGKKTYRWQVVEDAFTDCSVTCGKGYQTQLVVCVRIGANPKELGLGQFHSVDERHCRAQQKPVPDRLVCNTNVPCTPGAGSTTVSRGPKATVGSSDNKITYSETGMVWKPHQWGPCSASCGTGVRTRLVTCVDLSPLTSRSAPDERCDQLHKPADSEPCYAAPCNPTWLVSSWDVQCGESCGPDTIRRRRVICSDQLPRDGDPSDSPKKSRSYYDDVLGNFGKCDGRMRPPSEESCHSVLRSRGIDCSHLGQWMAGAWSQCSSTCGVPGWQTRSVVCLVQQQVANRDSCGGQEEPLGRQPCSPGIPCEPEVNQIDENEIPGVWFTSQWKNCSSPCGGTQDRDVICLSPDGRTVVHNCPWDERPQHRRSCNGEDEDGGKKCDEVLCIDKDPHCHLVARARLCHYEHYKTRCCQSCEIMNNNKKTVS